MTMVSNVSQTPSISKGNNIGGKNYGNMSFKTKQDLLKELTTTPSVNGANRSLVYRIKSINEVTLIDPLSPRFEDARRRLKIGKDEIALK